MYIYAIFNYPAFTRCVRAVLPKLRNISFSWKSLISPHPVYNAVLYNCKRGSKNLFLALMRDQNGKKFRNWDKMKSSKETVSA